MAVDLEQRVEPYGLVAKAGIWYLVYRRGEALRVQRVSRLLDARWPKRPSRGRSISILPHFGRTGAPSRKKVVPTSPLLHEFRRRLLPELPRLFGDRVRERIAQADPADAEGWITLELAFESLEAARDRLLSLGSGVEVIAPPRFAREPDRLRQANCSAVLACGKITAKNNGPLQPDEALQQGLNQPEREWGEPTPR